MKELIKNMLGQQALGCFDYFSKPTLKNIWGGAFNGQEFRRSIFSEIMAVFDVSHIIETGTFRGNTTSFMAGHNKPVYTVEFDKRNFGYVATRFFISPKVHTFRNDSRLFLKGLSKKSDLKKGNAFFYLDAHWGEDLPLKEELEIVFSNWDNAIVMVDDFKVPNTNYNYDDYGEGKALTLEYLKNVEHYPDMKFYFPVVNDENETGFKRGCIVITNSELCAQAISKMKTLYEWHESSVQEI